MWWCWCLQGICGFVWNDPNLTQYRGGPYVSDDGGVSFSWLFGMPSSTYNAAALRCPGVAVDYSTTNFPWIAVDPTNTDHLYLGGWGGGQGLHELVNSSWINWDACPIAGAAATKMGRPSRATASSNGGTEPLPGARLSGAQSVGTGHGLNGGVGQEGFVPKECFEGRRPDSYQQDDNTYTFDFNVDWGRSELRVITNGSVTPAPGDVEADKDSSGSTTSQNKTISLKNVGNLSASSNNSSSTINGTLTNVRTVVNNPLVYFTTSRGAVRVGWDPVNHRRSFKHFNNDLVDGDAV
jgi:hypothetical protein